MEEREIMRGILGKDAGYRLFVSGGAFGIKEIERLIEKLEIDKAIMAETDSGESDAGLVEKCRPLREGSRASP